MPSFAFSPTPNPNSIKITTDAGVFLEGGMLSFASPEEAAGNPLGRRLFEQEGVINVFILPQFITVTKRGDISWDMLLPAVEAVLAAHFAAPS